MEQNVEVADRVPQRHPELSKEDVIAAWNSRLKCQVRLGPWPPQYAAIGFDGHGRSVEMVAVYDPNQDSVLVFHARTPATKKFKRELGIG